MDHMADNMHQSERSTEAIRPKRKRVPRAIREPQMLDAATEVFSQRGFHAASMDEIASRVSVTKPMLYAYFGSKEGLYSAAVKRAGNHIVKLANGLLNEPDPQQRLKEGTQVLFDFVFSQRAAWAMVYNERMGPDGIVNVTEFRTQVLKVVAKTLVELRAREHGDVSAGDDAQVAAAMPYAIGLMGSCESLLRWWIRYSPFEQSRCMQYGHRLVQAHAQSYITEGSS